MKSILIILLCTVAFGLEYQSCSTVSCGTGANNQCISVYTNNKTTIVTPCSANQTCADNGQFSGTTGNWAAANCAEKSAQPSPSIDCSVSLTTLTGKPCCNDNNCKSGSCDNGICEGLSNGANCTVDEECRPGYYCKSTNWTFPTNGTNVTNETNLTGLCSDSLSSGDICTFHNECPIGYGCNNSTCTQLFSQDINAVVSDKRFCKSDFIRNGKCDGIYIRSNNTRLSSPYACTIGQRCNYVYASDNAVAAEDWCQCGGVKNDTGYCGSFGNVIGYWDEVFPKLQYSRSDCSGNYSHTDNFAELFNCSSLSSIEEQYLEGMNEQATYWTLYQSGAIDSCVNQLGLFPTNVTLGSDTSGAMMMVISSILLIFA
ncbi:unnamed protein product [Blepharisma stoltei]|uniref:Uncharacterized protein n=1 Tax=Blepharisma stoltei TaxID=1481888 RepID=A0AAU9JRM8_9CILI|nr:unnamed protein product [Blepharisma stoltei]